MCSTSSPFLISSTLLISLFCLLSISSVSSSSHHSHHPHKKLHLCGKRLATTISAMCSERSIDECPVKGDDFKGSIIRKCCSGQCYLKDIRAYCCAINKTEKQIEDQSNYLDLLEPQNENNSGDEESYPKKVHHSHKDRYEVLNL